MRNSHADVLADLKAGKLTDNAASTIEKVAADLSAKYKCRGIKLTFEL